MERQPVLDDKVTIMDIAKAAGVSKSTVSLVLNNSSLVRHETAVKVKETAEKMGYVYNRSAANLRNGTSNIIGMVVNDLSNSFFVELLIGAERRLLSSNYITLLAHTGEDLKLQDQVLASMREQKAAGVILCPALYTSPNLTTTLKNWGLPFVTVMRSLNDEQSDFVGCDNYLGIQMATQHLIGLGHRDIAFIGRDITNSVSVVRQQGYTDCLEKNNIPVNPQLMVESDISMMGGKKGMKKLLSLRKCPSAVVCYNDLIAIGVLSEINEQGLITGRDIAVVGSDGVASSAFCSPPLTTVVLHSEKIGELASQVLLKRLKNPELPPIRHLLKPELRIRKSCGAYLK
ncbi:LacI family DNA-binding transcriptional regulator [Sodalis ligni]|uniref:LacI family transcriptional regulator n=1 Tax=Sodalis ligni TaxID=2697027 RepID=A0A4R1NF46_9GAMM|nr:LacI family DNA-binding transcriptional regulator [Sodalis ligni]TCL06274.1 LacI family transcriptional regulator [Sodalis ligni]